jgi:hypothetical protein
VDGISGRYFFRGKEIKSSPASYDADCARRLWEISRELTEASPKANLTGMKGIQGIKP